MQITLSPIRMDETLSVTVRGESLTINGIAHDLAGVTEGAPLAAVSPWIVGPVERAEGRLRFTLLLPHGANAPFETRFPVPVVDPPDGPLVLPPYEAEEEEEAGGVEETDPRPDGRQGLAGPRPGV